MNSQGACSPKGTRKESLDSAASTTDSLIVPKTLSRSFITRKGSVDSAASTTDSVTVPKTLSSSFIHADAGKPLECIPDIRMERKWFNHFDVHGFGMLSKLEATAAIQRTFTSFNAEKLSSIVDTVWPDFVKDSSGLIGLEGMLRKQTGLVDVSLRMYQLASATRTYSL